MSNWTPTSWQSFPVSQLPVYPDDGALQGVLNQLHALPPLVTSWEIEALKTQLAEAAQGDRFLLQGGDCAERFDECCSDRITRSLKVLLQMSLALVYGTGRRVIRVGRFAGQYAKPRSSDSETIDGVTLPSYRGDLVNQSPFEESGRTPDPQLLLRGYERAALTLNFIRALIDGGFADLHHPEFWDLDWMEHAAAREAYEGIVDSVGNALRFMETLTNTPVGVLNRVDFFTSHEALHLYYEQAQTRTVPRRDGYYNLSTHFPWIGMRTAQLDCAHVEYCRGIRNPIGIKIGPGLEPTDLPDLLDTLDPQREPGRITLIHRYGARNIATGLPPAIAAVQKTGRTVLWVCDPMHGNTEKSPSGYKTRKFEHILAEFEQSFEIHAACGSHLGGVHVEVTGDNVTECTGGARGLDDTDLARSYESVVDPRLNYEQAIELALLVAKRLR